MKNLNESRKPENELTTADIAGKSERVVEKPRSVTGPNPSEVVPFERKSATGATDSTPLLPKLEADEFHNKWNTIQTGFVDEPRRAVQEADKLVARSVQRVAEVFAEERAKLEQQWSRGEQISTEDLRVVLQRYRSFFSRLLTI